MAFIDRSNEPTYIPTKDGMKAVDITKREYNKNLGCYIIREYKEIKKKGEHYE